MKRAWLRWMSLLGVFAAAPVLAQAAGGIDAGPGGRVIVKFKPNVAVPAEKSMSATGIAQARAAMFGKRLGISLEGGIHLSEHSQVVASRTLSSAELAARLEADSDVEYAVPDQRRQRRMVPNDPYYRSGIPGRGPAAGQWYLRAPTDTLKSAINAEGAWAFTTGNPGVIVAVLDTGVRFDHPDLKAVSAGGNLLPGYDFISDAIVANDGGGRDADASDPGDWVTDAEASNTSGPLYGCYAEDSSWHGTQVSGLIAALTDNGLGIASVGRNVRVLPLRVLGKCGGYDSDIIAAMRWAVGLAVPGLPTNTNKARVLNMSLGGSGACSAAYQDVVSAVTAAGGVIVAAAGNSSGHAVEAPANCAGVVAVGGLRHAGTKVGYSDLGPEVTISAPAGNCVNSTGECMYPIMTTTNTGLTSPVEWTYTDGENASYGTSFSAPLVSGTLALMFSAQSALTSQQAIAALQATARAFTGAGSVDSSGALVPQCRAPYFDRNGNAVDQVECVCTTSTCGAGMLDAAAAVAAASSATVTKSEKSAQSEGMWNSPIAAELGWGINFAQQDDVIFATWFTYDVNGAPWWLVASLKEESAGSGNYSGTLSTFTGPPFGSTFVSSQVDGSTVGSMRLSFASANNALLNYSVSGLSKLQPITRQIFGTVPSCTWSSQVDLAGATNYQDMWWNPSESGWGINFTHQSDRIYATWFTYDVSGKPWWLTAVLDRVSGGSLFSGEVLTYTGPSFGPTFDVKSVKSTSVGYATVLFSDGNHATFTSTVNGTTQTKVIQRQVWGPAGSGTVCR